MKPWKTKTRSTVLNQRPWLLVENHLVELPDGRLIPNWPWIITPDYVNVVAVTAEERFICFRQVKYGVEGTTLGIVGGFIEEGEEPIRAASRELLEETGYESTDWIPLGSYRGGSNRGGGMGDFNLARQGGLVYSTNGGGSGGQGITTVARLEMGTGLAQGEFKVLAWAAAIA